MEFYTIPVHKPDGAGKLIMYRPLARLAFVGNKAMADLTRRLIASGAEDVESSEPLKFLLDIGFLEPDNPPPALAGGDFFPTTAVLLLTNQCQLRCTYCYASAGEYKFTELTPELGKAAILHVYENAKRLGRARFDVNFHGGGEPTLAWKTLQECVTYARQMDIPAHISLTTNGIWSRKKTEWLTRSMDDISLSFDGSPQTQDHNRPTINGRGSSNILMQTIKELDRQNFKYGIRMTATAPWSDFPKDVRFICEETKCPSMQVEPAFNTQRGEHFQPDVNEALAFGEAYMEAFDYASRAGRQLSYSGARVGKVTSTFCTAPYQALVINGHGELVSCYEITGDNHPLSKLSTIGKIVNGKVEVNQKARNDLHQKMDQRREACRECACYWSCAGDCYTRSFQPGENGHLQFGARCELNRYLLGELLLWEISRGDGIWRGSQTRN